MECVEDIPGDVLRAGLPWQWESFPQYLANVERLPKAINYGVYIGHSALRMYVMGRRALDEAATEDDLHRMADAVELQWADPMTRPGLSATQRLESVFAITA